MIHLILVWVDGLIATHVAYFKCISSILQEVFERCIVNNGGWGRFFVPKGEKKTLFLDCEVCVGVCVCVSWTMMIHFLIIVWVEGRCEDHGRYLEDIFLQLKYYTTKLIVLGVKVVWKKMLLLLLFC